MRPLVRVCSIALLSSVLAACGGGRGDDDDSAPDGDADADGDGDADADADGDADTDGDADGDADACVPAAGDEIIQAHCDEVEIAVLAGGGPTRVQVRGRLSFGLGDGTCARADSVDVLRGQELVQILDGAPGALGLDLTSGRLAEGEADAALSVRCGTDEDWADRFGLVVRGRVDGGTYEARCGSADSGSGWPPRVLLTCHEGLAEPPGRGNAMVTGGDGFTWTDLYAYFPHPDGQAITAVGDAIRILPSFEPWGFGGATTEPFDTQGWTAWVGETDIPGTGITTQASLHADGDPLGLAVCPLTPPEPDPQAPLPPVFLARVTGTTEIGPFSSELYVSLCTRAAN